MTEIETHTLSRPLKTHKGAVETITLNEPHAGLFRKYGEPFKTKIVRDDAGKVVDVEFVYEDSKAMLGFIAGMTEIDDILLESLSAYDFTQIRSIVTMLITAGARHKDPTELSGA